MQDRSTSPAPIELHSQRPRLNPWRSVEESSRWPQVLACLALGAAYFASAKLGEALAFPSAPVSALWAPNAILFAAFLLVPPRRWWIFLAAILPVHVLAQISNTPPIQILIQYVANCGQALMGAAALNYFAPQPRRFDRLRTMANLIVFGSILAPLIASVAMAAAFVLFNLTTAFALTTVARTLTNAFATLTLVPLIVTVAMRMRTQRITPQLRAGVEAVLLITCLAIVGAVVFVTPHLGVGQSPALLYAPLPFLLWATVRFGITGVCGSILLLGGLSTWGVLNGYGPFTAQLPVQNALSLVLFLVVTCIPLLLLAALLQERKEAAHALVQSEAKFRSIFESDIAPTVLFTCDGLIIEANDAFLRLVRRSRADIAARAIRWDLLLRPEDADALARARREVKTHGRFTPRDSEILLPDGRRVPVFIGGCQLPGEPGTGVGFAFDLSDVRRADAARERMQVLHRAVLASIEDQVAVLDHAGTILEVNESWKQARDRSSVKLAGVTPGESYLNALAAAGEHGDVTSAKLCESLKDVLSGVSPRRQLEFSAQCEEGTHWFEQSIEPLQRPEGGAVITLTDISARKRVENEVHEQQQQLAHLARAAVLGELSGTIAHEINQPLTALLGNAEASLRMLRAKPMDLDAIYEIQQDIVADIVRAGQVIERVRSLLRRGEMDHQPLELNDVTESVLALTRSDLGRRGVSLDVHLAPGLAPVKGDRVQMQQVLLNLLVNASEAMADVATEQRRLMVATRDGPRPYEVELMVADHGPGIAAERLEHIFEPFYTTKASGLGLGLAVCRSIMQAHGGRLWAANSAHGAVFHVTFPKQV